MNGGDGGEASLPPAPEIEPAVYPEDLRDVPRWLTWKPADDGRKIPRAPYEHPDWPDKYVSAQNPAVWTDFDTARKWADRLSGYGLAFNIPDRDDHDTDHVLIDYDDARDPETGEIHPTVREHIERAGSYADVSTSGTGVHIFARGSLPDGVKAIEAPLPDAEGFDGAEIEVYDSARYSAMTGDHIEGTPRRTTDCRTFLEDVADNYATVAEGTPDELTREPRRSADELADVETTTDLQDVFDAIQHTRPRDIRLRSTVTHERGDGSKSLDPSWADSKSGTRLAQVDGGWVYRQGMKGLDALQVVALEERIITREGEYPTGDDFWDAVDALRNRGAHVPEYEPADAVPKAVLPDAGERAVPSDEWAWQTADRPEPDLSKDEVYDRVQETIGKAVKRGTSTLVDAIPSAGKSHGAVKAIAQAGVPATILTGRGRVERYGELREWCEQEGLKPLVLPSFARDCPTAAGDHGDGWRERVLDWYNRGATPREIHKHAEHFVGEPLPCSQEGGCPLSQLWDFDPDEYDVLIGHYTHAHKPQVTAGRAVVLDEFPGDAYESEFDHGIEGAVSLFLQSTPLPFEDWADLMENRTDPDRQGEALAWFEDRGVERDAELVFAADEGHAYAPLVTYAIIAAADDGLGNGWEYATFPDHGRAAFDREENVAWVLRPPEFKAASAVVGLDGTPTERMWRRATGRHLSRRQVLSNAERRKYIETTQNLRFVPTTEYIKPYNNAGYVNVDADGALFEAVADRHDADPGLITTTTAKAKYRTADLLDHCDGAKHYGNLLGSNEFEDKRVGVVAGSQHYGDHFIERWAAYDGVAAEREGRGADLSYGDYGDELLTHMREHQTLQAAMRFGRDGKGAVVYVHTNTLPEWVPTAGEGRVVHTHSDGMRQVVTALDGGASARTAEIADHAAVEIGQRQVFDHLETLRERGYVDRVRSDVDGRGYVWQGDDLARVGDHGEVQLPDVELDALDDGEVAELARTTFYTWEFRNSGAFTPPSAANGGEARAARADDGRSGAAPPPAD